MVYYTIYGCNKSPVLLLPHLSFTARPVQLVALAKFKNAWGLYSWDPAQSSSLETWTTMHIFQAWKNHPLFTSEGEHFEGDWTPKVFSWATARVAEVESFTTAPDRVSEGNAGCVNLSTNGATLLFWLVVLCLFRLPKIGWWSRTWLGFLGWRNYQPVWSVFFGARQLRGMVVLSGWTTARERLKMIEDCAMTLNLMWTITQIVHGVFESSTSMLVDKAQIYMHISCLYIYCIYIYIYIWWYDWPNNMNFELVPSPVCPAVREYAKAVAVGVLLGMFPKVV